MTDDEADSLIDAQLRNVAVPAELAARLRTLAQWPDEEVDRELTGVAIPFALGDRLKDIATHEELDEQLQDLPQPLGMRLRLRKIAARSQRWQTVAMRTLAASLLLTVSLGYGAFTLNLLFGIRGDGDSIATTFTIMRPASVELEAEQADVELVFAAEVDGPGADPAETEFVSLLPAETWLAANSTRPAPVEEILAAGQAGKLNRPLTMPILGAPIQDDLPQLDLVRLPQARGVATPLVPGYNRAFLLHRGVHPPILPGLNPVLQQSLAPISLATDSFDQVHALLTARKRIAADMVRTEDFIAAIQHDLPAPAAGDVSLSVFGSVSPFGPDRTRLLGLGVKAGEATTRQRPTTHLVIALDFSAGLNRSGHWPWVRESLLESLARLGSDDRISLVFYQDEVLMASAPLARHDLPLLRKRLTNAAPTGEVDPACGVEAALDLALAAETPARTRRIVVLTDGHFELASQHHRRLKLVAEQAGQAGIDLDVIQLGGGRSVAGGAAIVSQAMSVPRSNFDSRRSLAHGLLSLLHGDEAIAATEAKLVVRFAPEAVAAYRLVGHEANTMAQLTPPSQVVELRAGDAALVMFELLPTAHRVETIAQVELSWLIPSSGERRSVQRSVSRSELSQPWDGSPPAFRAATIAAEAAEQLRGSRAALRELKWTGNDRVEFADLLGQARALRASANEADFSPLVSLLQAAADHEPRR